MSTKAEEVRTQALSPGSTLLGVLAAAPGVVEVAGASSAARKSEAAPEIESITAANEIDRAILAGLIELLTFRELRDTRTMPRNM